ncbi:MAG: PLDc N-terminal domain-containing protein, partial [Bacteroidaceae bacterium]|nr:PLDc N-terminal domain-containing protein [Bacteroidaceae bacterium]
MMIGGLFDSVFSTAVSLLFFLTVVATVMVVILDNRNPFKTLVWVLVLIFLPVVGLILYFFFGQDTRKEKLISKKGFERLSKYPMMEFQEQESFPISKLESHSVVRFFQRINNALPFEGNGMDICSDGYTMIQSLLKAIDRAKHHIHIQFYIFEDDAVGRLVRDALMDKAR